MRDERAAAAAATTSSDADDEICPFGNAKQLFSMPMLSERRTSFHIAAYQRTALSLSPTLPLSLALSLSRTHRRASVRACTQPWKKTFCPLFWHCSIKAERNPSVLHTDKRANHRSSTNGSQPKHKKAHTERVRAQRAKRQRARTDSAE